MQIFLNQIEIVSEQVSKTKQLLREINVAVVYIESSQIKRTLSKSIRFNLYKQKSEEIN